MALRVSKNEKKWLQTKNYSAKRKVKRLYYDFGLRYTFKVRPVSTFKTRAELNAYKYELKKYLLHGTHSYVKGGLLPHQTLDTKIPDYYHFPIPRTTYNEIQRALKKSNKAIYKQLSSFEKMTFMVQGRPQDMTTRERVEQYFPNIRYSFSHKGLAMRGASYYPLRFQTENIYTAKTLKNFERAVKKFRSPVTIQKKELLAKENFKSALANTFGNNANPLINLIDNLSTKDFIGWFESEDFMDFGYVYDTSLATSILRDLTLSFFNYATEQKLPIDKDEMKQAGEVAQMNSADILGEYDKGSLGGYRLKLKTDGNYKYIDLTPEEYEEYLKGYDVTDIPNFNERLRQMSHH